MTIAVRMLEKGKFNELLTIFCGKTLLHVEFRKIAFLKIFTLVFYMIICVKTQNRKILKSSELTSIPKIIINYIWTQQIQNAGNLGIARKNIGVAAMRNLFTGKQSPFGESAECSEILNCVLIRHEIYIYFLALEGFSSL